MRFLLIGANGQLGTELGHLLNENNIEYTGITSKQLDITDKEAVYSYFNINKPEIVYDCAAYTNVDAAEEEPGKTINHNVNAVGTKNITQAAEKVGSTLVYISTDYVFDGTKTDMYKESDVPNPKNEYGQAKLLGEKAVSEIMSKYYIIRTSWIFGKYGKNFVKTMLKLSKTHNRLTVVDDQVGRPTWTRTLAEFMLFVIQNNTKYGIYQLSNDGYCSWYEFSREVLKDKGVDIVPIDSESYPQKAYRPKHSVMSLEKAKSCGFDIIDWKEALKILKNNN
ncbi:dTDP-4-dehydrorhamnose reductase [Companilactobacillus zhachilii]|uniref:dTDP-4-dehydrorhamnose reductase n=1 Tax=Companilactobacillus zhachilii TaxID=2304606 RepID=UPI001922C2F1|nr:dTDP-4-dehydrorhamnose reductase [Companilactobacillus zhachilii]MBL3532015.1 dTDP-4-dehydrorhamnose reductase [Companilactobacillus zhachilii]